MQIVFKETFSIFWVISKVQKSVFIYEKPVH